MWYTFFMPKKKGPNIKRVKPDLPGGFRDFAPAEAIIKQRLLEKVRKTFEEFGFDPLETPAVEKTEILRGGEENSEQLIFTLNPAKRGGTELKDLKKDQLSLRFDLTVPLARFLAANPELPRPFRRYQIGRVWRGERQQAGRFREFTQADIDIVGSSSPEADAEIIYVVYQLFKSLGLNRFLIKVNNRKILNCLPSWAGFPEKKLFDVLRVIDKKDKIGEQTVKKELVRIVKKQAAERLFSFLKTEGDVKTKLFRVKEDFKNCAPAQEGIKELVEIIRLFEAMKMDRENWELDFSIVRGLGYYTGTIFETTLLAAPEFGSVASGGRYDKLMMPFTGEKLPAVGISIGVDRLLASLEKMELLKKKPTKVKVLVLNLSPELRTDYYSFAGVLRGAGIPTEIYFGDDRTFQAQLAYAVKKEIPYVLIYGDSEKQKNAVTIKNMSAREQKEIPKTNILQYFKK
mgnify:CR=1 FL=1